MRTSTHRGFTPSLKRALASFVPPRLRSWARFFLRTASELFDTSYAAYGTRARSSAGFTLIELMVVITVIGLLSSTVITSMRTVRMKAKDARRVSDLRAVRQALELYNSTYNNYPSTSGAWRSQCSTWGGYSANNVIPGLAPQYITAVPADPDMVVSGTTCCYLYISNGTNYKFLAHNCPAIEYARFPTMLDPRRDGGTNNCAVDGNAPWALGIYTNGMCAT